MQCSGFTYIIGIICSFIKSIWSYIFTPTNYATVHASIVIYHSSHIIICNLHWLYHICIGDGDTCTCSVVTNKPLCLVYPHTRPVFVNLWSLFSFILRPDGVRCLPNFIGYPGNGGSLILWYVISHILNLWGMHPLVDLRDWGNK